MESKPTDLCYQFYCDTCGQSFSLENAVDEKEISPDSEIFHPGEDGTMHAVRRITKQ